MFCSLDFGVKNYLRVKNLADGVTFATMMLVYKNMGTLDSAIEVAEQMKQSGLLRDCVTYNKVMACYATNGQLVECGKMLHEMMVNQKLKLVPYGGACKEGRHFSEAVRQLQSSYHEGRPFAKPAVITYVFSIVGVHAYALESCGVLTKEGVGFNLFVYNATIRAYVAYGKTDEALKMFMRMQDERIGPDLRSPDKVIEWNPQRSDKALWDHLNKTFSMSETRPSEDDLADHVPLIAEAVKGDDCFDPMCAICDNGGVVYACEGKCMRSFHATIEDGADACCESLGLTAAELQSMENVAFYCENCKHKKHQCFACGELGSSDESSSPEVFCCVDGACRFFYHPYCVAQLLHPRDNAAAEQLQQRIAAGEQFACPAHRCDVCKEVEVKSIKELQFAVCRRCPRAYHRKCLPREIATEDDMDMERGIIQRAWEDLIPNRVLIYCLDHEIDPYILTPVRDHIKFPGPWQAKKKKLQLEFSKKMNKLKERSLALKENAGDRISAKPPKGDNKVSSTLVRDDRSGKRVEKFSTLASSKKQKRNFLGKSKEANTNVGEMSLGGELYAIGEHEITQKDKPQAKRIDNSLTLDARMRKRLLALMKDASSSVTLDQVKERHKSPSTHSQYSKHSAESSTFGNAEGSVQVNQKMIHAVTASIMHWSLQQPVEESDSSLAAASHGASPQPSVDEAQSPAPASISDAAAIPSNNGCASPACATIVGASTVPSVSGDENYSIVSKISRLTIDEDGWIVISQADESI